MPIEIRGLAILVNFLIVLVPIIFIGSGICSLFWPGKMWFLAEGWKFKDVQPSGCYLVAIRAGGIVSLILGVVSFVIVWGLIQARGVLIASRSVVITIPPWV